jgi:hypothetical protein
VDAWWWLATSLLAWFGVSLVAGLLLSPFFRRSSRVRDALDAQAGETRAERQDPPEDGPCMA